MSTQLPTIVPLELSDVAKHFGRLSVLRDVELAVSPQEVVGLIGANGAGKTTLLSIVAGLVQPTSGSRRFGGREGHEVDMAIRAKMALVTHTAQTYGRLTATENLALFADLRRAAGWEADEPAPLLARLGLEHAAHRLAGTFSRGMLQRLALARALLGRPELLLLDEPFTALDRPGRTLLARVLLEERARGAAILLSSHDFDAMTAVADRVVLLEGGVIVGQAVRRTDADPQGTGFGERVHELAGHLEAVQEGDGTRRAAG